MENVAIANALQLESLSTSRESFWAVFGRIGTAHSHRPLILRFRSKFWHRH